jgi:hypothetical protein
MRKLLISLSLATASYAAIARPGTINYTEGNVTLNGAAVATKSLGSAELAPGQLLETGAGKAEMLLTPGVFLRLGDQSAVRMVSPSLTDTRVELVRGRALLEVDLLEKENQLDIQDHGVDVRIQKKGIYGFNADQPLLAVYDGKATAQLDDRAVEVDKGKDLPLQRSSTVKPQKFDRNQTDDLSNWSKLRSEYVAQANAASVQTVVLDNPSWWAGTGWYWNPWYSTWAFIPGSGFYGNPWGFGFYSPSYWFYNPPVYYFPRPVPGWVGGRRVTVPRAVGPATSFGAVPHSSAPAPPRMGGGGARFGGRR